MALLAAAARRLPRHLRLLTPRPLTTSSPSLPPPGFDPPTEPSPVRTPPDEQFAVSPVLTPRDEQFAESPARTPRDELFAASPVRILRGELDAASPVRTPPDEQFAAWVTRLRPGFTASDLAAAISVEPDPDLALALFRWAALRPGFRHTPDSYLAALTAASSGRRPAAAEALVHDVFAGACAPDLRLFNACLRFCCARRSLFPLAFDMFNKMRALPASAHCRPDVETYTLLFTAVVRRVRRPPASLVYLHAIRSLSRQMKVSGVVPDTFLLNLIIKAYARCLEIDDALKVFREMPLYGCEPNEFTYGYIVKAMFQKGRTDKGLVYFAEAREKGFVPSGGVYMIGVSALALEWRFEESKRVLLDMLDCKRKPDMITYRTLLEEMCRAGRTEEAFEVLEELKDRKRGPLDQRMYSELLDGLHWIAQPHPDNRPVRDKGSDD